MHTIHGMDVFTACILYFLSLLQFLIGKIIVFEVLYEQIVIVSSSFFPPSDLAHYNAANQYLR